MGFPHGYCEKPVHNVHISKSFYMCTHEVTQEEWQEVMDTHPSYWEGSHLPVGNISWYDAVEYCNRRSREQGLETCYTGEGQNITCDFSSNGYRLPTEAEWEYAAGGGDRSRQYVYAGSNDIDDVAWYTGNSGLMAHEVELKSANQVGLYDMSGNVWEWCWDKYGKHYYFQSPTRSPWGESNIVYSYRVARGGSWKNFGEYCRSTCRNSHLPSARYGSLGFRVVMEP